MTALAEALTVSLPAIRGRAVARRFVLALLLSAVLPFPLLALLSGPYAAAAPAQDSYRVLFLLSVAHGGLSGLFWLDARYRGHMATQPRFYYVDAALILGLAMTGALIIGSSFCIVFGIIFTVWTVVHFARQNWGVLCLTALACGDDRPGRLERRAHGLACAGGIIGVLPGMVLDLLPDGTATLGLVLAVLGFVLGLMVAADQISKRQSAARVAMTVAIAGFFLPVYVLGPVAGFVAIGTVHGAQYAVIMSVLAANGQPGRSWPRIVGMLLCACVYLGLYLLLHDAPIWGAWTESAKVLLYTVVMWHFILDAGLWRLSRPFQRNVVRQSFPFLFANRQVQE